MQCFHPRDPSVISWIDTLSPRAELVTRLAMRRVFSDCCSDRHWRARTDALIAQVTPDITSLAQALEDADKTAAMIRFAVKAGG